MTKTRKLMKEREREKMNRLQELGAQKLILLKAGEFVGIGDTSSCFECVIKLFQKISGKYKKCRTSVGMLIQFPMCQRLSVTVEISMLFFSV